MFAAFSSVACSASLAGTAAPPFPQPSGWPIIAKATRSSEPLGPGVSLAHVRLATADGPLAISIVRADLRNPYVSLAAAAHHDGIVGPGEPLRDMAERVGAEAGINGDYFDINGSGAPLNALVIGGRVEHSGDGKAAFVAGRDNRVSMGVVSWSATLTNRSGFTLPIPTVNDLTGAAPTLVTPLLGAAPAGEATCVVLDPDRDPATYRVIAIDRNVLALPLLRADQLAVAARGGADQPVTDGLSVGDVVELRQSTALDGVALTPGDIATAVGGGPLLLRDGRPFDDPNPPAAQEANQRYPVSGAGVSADGSTLWLVVVDGRSPKTSIGITRPMLGSLLAALGASDAIGFDTGGSAELVGRRLGDLRPRVANVPSDGRERAIADGLFVVNSASIGPVADLVVRSPFGSVLVGSHLAFRVAAVDAHDQPVPIGSGRVSFSSDAPGIASVGKIATLTAHRPGVARIRAAGYGSGGLFNVRVVNRVAQLRIADIPSEVPVGSIRQLAIEARSGNGEPIAVDASQVRWTLQGRGAQLGAGGVLSAGAEPARVRVSAAVAGARASREVEIGEHDVAVDLAQRRWRYASLPAGLPGAVDDEPAPDGSAALRLAYDFSTSRGVRAAYAERDIALGGRPVALAIEVFGDGKGEALRGAYRNADGVVDTVAIARSVEWSGWRSVRAAVPDDARYPITWLRLYAFGGRSDQNAASSLWFRNFRAVYPGP